MTLRALSILAALSLMALVVGRPAEARIIAILFDTSGSMQERFQLPSFGTRLIAATVDGRAGFDRLLIMNFNDYVNQGLPILPGPGSADGLNALIPGAIVETEIRSAAEHERLLRELIGRFRWQDVGTPYGPIELMLERIADELEASPRSADGELEEVVFVLVSDGEYIGGDPDIFARGAQTPELRRRFEAWRARIEAAGGSLRAEYLFINVGVGENNRDLADIVRDQEVRDTLLEVFNGPMRGPDGELDGSRVVETGDELWEALQDIVASVAGTDRAAQAAFIDYSGRTITVTPPLSINRVVIVSTAPVGRPVPTRQSDTFGTDPTDARRLAVPMPGEDRLFPRSQRAGLVEHLWFQRPIPSGQAYTLEFDAPVDEDVFLLFETGAQVGLRILDADGAEVMPDASGVHTLYAGRSYRFESQIEDAGPGGAVSVVDLDTLPASLTMTLSVTGQAGIGTRSMEVDRIADLGASDWVPEALGPATASSRASAGIFSPSSRPLSLMVLDPVTTLAVSPLRSTEPCDACGEGDVASPVTGETADVQVGAFDVSAQGTLDGAIVFDPVPEGFEIRDQDGNPVVPGADIPFAAVENRTFTLWRQGAVDPEILAEGAADIDISVRPSGGWTGAPAEAAGRVLLVPPDLRIVFVTSSAPLPDGRTEGLEAPAPELLGGSYSAQFSLVDILDPPTGDTVDERVSVTSNRGIDRLVAFEVLVPSQQTGFNALDVRLATNYWCLCWLWAQNGIAGTPERTVTIAYLHEINGRPIQQASTEIPMAFPVDVTRGTLSCLLNLAIAILAYAFLRGIIALITTHRFPRGARVEIVEPDERVNYKRLDKGNTVWLRAWFAAITGNPDEVRTIEGLRLRATTNGALLDISRTTPAWTLDRLGETFSELKESQPRKSEYKILWDDRFESVAPPGRVLYLRKGRGRR